ncbi:hypothetical protein [Parvibaculum sp.]|uniref:hypothetical protein n=1 Tax=Parvibaculum sp. TaxID=2024848 RepID=UPI00272F6009|nr:hypothetical protein [Parvibaculum sp.]MDP1628838.1 hypothetical protein [Parvibaculum sp.]MDP2148233.1 hypothetical protein [Parvibaculum sp.]MDP3326655.1 hypothetical protein [Parvibaculum sp.]
MKDREKMVEPMRKLLGELTTLEAQAHAASATWSAMAEKFNAMRESIVEKMTDEGVILGKCVGCETLLFEGDKGFRYSEGEMSCEACASTYQEMKEEAEASLAAGGPDDEFRESSERILKCCEEHVAAGGSLAEKWIWEL